MLLNQLFLSDELLFFFWRHSEDAAGAIKTVGQILWSVAATPKAFGGRRCRPVAHALHQPKRRRASLAAALHRRLISHE
jgi:hypothetical protein